MIIKVLNCASQQCAVQGPMTVTLEHTAFQLSVVRVTAVGVALALWETDTLAEVSHTSLSNAQLFLLMLWPPIRLL